MMPVVKSLLSIVFAISITTAVAQKPAAAKSTGIEKFKPPKLTCTLGAHADSAIVLRDEAVQLIALPLKITDDKKNIYSISSYQLMYKRRAVTEDEETGKVSPIMSNVSNLFRETPITPLWTKILNEQLRAGEELYFFDIVAKDANGRLMFAPELRIKIK
jgi:hypothetical protein